MREIPILLPDKIDREPPVFGNVTLSNVTTAMQIGALIGVLMSIVLMFAVSFSWAMVLGLLIAVLSTMGLAQLFSRMGRQKPPYFLQHYFAVQREYYGFGQAGFVYREAIYEAFRS